MPGHSTHFWIGFAAICGGAGCGARSELYAFATSSGGAGGTSSSAAAGAGGNPSAAGACSGNSASCVTAVCGNQQLEAGEECDDGNVVSGDGCSAACTWEPTAITARGIRVCALGADGAVKCWGDNEFGELGLGDTMRRGDAPGEMGHALPSVSLSTSARAISAGYLHDCALLDDGGVKCWGDNRFGGLGQGDIDNRGDDPNEMGDRLPEVALGTGQIATAIAAGDAFTCALLESGAVKCWGYNYSGDIEEGGQLGLGDRKNRGDEPGEMGDQLPALSLGTGRTALAIAAGTDSSCAILDHGAVKCWGVNAFGQLGQADTENRGDNPGEMGDSLLPVQLGTGRSATQIGVGYDYSCALLDDGQIKCWGLNDSGQLGLGDRQERGVEPGQMGDSLPEVALGTGERATALAVGFESACALLKSGAVKCWGNGSFGQLGQGDSLNRGDQAGEMGDSLLAVSLGTGRTAKAITSGYSSACALLDDGTLKCWGFNQYGELGLGDADSRGDDPNELGDRLPAVDVGF
jgi:cysteine-rich repeat protein